MAVFQVFYATKNQTGKLYKVNGTHEKRTNARKTAKSMFPIHSIHNNLDNWIITAIKI